jgi:copper homeostasis protein
MPLLLEVIVQSVADARAARRGGADRLEVVREIERGGLTPSIDLVRAIAHETNLPLRVMVRQSDGYSIADSRELTVLQRAIASLTDLGVDGVVVGFARDGTVDLETTKAVISDAPLNVTFHHAFDDVNDPEAAIETLRTVPQVDRILTAGGRGDWRSRCRRFARYAAVVGSRPIFPAGGGVDDDALGVLAASGCVQEVHVGRAAREPRLPDAPVSALRVRELKDILSRPSS